MRLQRDRHGVVNFGERPPGRRLPRRTDRDRTEDACMVPPLLGSAAGLSPATVTRLTQQWQADHAAFMDRDLSEADYVYVWADGIHLNVRLEQDKACVLVLIGVRVDGSKELVAFQNGYRESAASWADLMLDCARRGMRAPVLAVGDGALGFWKALSEVFPATCEQRCWTDKTAAIQDICNAEDRDHAETAIKTSAKALRREVA